MAHTHGMFTYSLKNYAKNAIDKHDKFLNNADIKTVIYVGVLLYQRCLKLSYRFGVKLNCDSSLFQSDVRINSTKKSLYLGDIHAGMKAGHTSAMSIKAVLIFASSY